ncbi:MAG: ribulose-5-phosphate 3-epimerase [Erysipelotrichaceae bacterium]|nr:MAG: ribulose-5-phosphate [Erysipelotrichaceae bacterium]TXT19043.1 MAG: ribulose-5-phosphate 3-epimerase [Erysipelotrichaceae bacterium]
MIIAPSILSMDFSKIPQQLSEVEKSPAKWLHVDIMDGHFVPNLTFGPDFVKSIRTQTSLFLDVHIMVSDPVTFADVFIQAGADLITFHYEALEDSKAVLDLIRKIKSKGKKAGLSLRPATPIQLLFPFLNELDLVLVMSVNPGFGGQAFMPEALVKVTMLKRQIKLMESQCLIEIDGGINQDTGTMALNSGVDVLVAGSYVFKNNIGEAIKNLWENQSH